MAVKNITVGAGKEGVHVTTLREIKLLRELRSPHLVQLLDVFQQRKKISLVGPRPRAGAAPGC